MSSFLHFLHFLKHLILLWPIMLFFKRIKLILYLTLHQINLQPFQSDPVLLFEQDSPPKEFAKTNITQL
jgi:hypothetical protein